MPDRPNVIMLFPGASGRTKIVLENMEHIESLPIDGMIMDIPQSFWLMDPPGTVPEGAGVTAENIAPWMPPELTDLNARMENNYLITYIDDPADLFDDDVWAGVVENFRLMAEAAKDANFKGLIFDNEEYGGTWDNFPEDYPGATADQLAQYQAQASLRGQQIMEAVNSVFPEGAFGVMHGPYASVDGGDQTPQAVRDQVGSPENQELRGPFFTGLLEGMGPGQTLIDMGELYGARSNTALAQSQEYRSNVVPDLIDWEVDPALLANWDDNVVISHMISTDTYPRGGITPETFRATVNAALANSEETVFIYSSSTGPGTDGIVFDWLTPGAVPQEWIDAVAGGIADFEAGILPGANPDDGQLIRGSGARDTLEGGIGDDTLQGGNGNDRLTGGEGADQLRGGNGFDHVFYTDSTEGVSVSLVSGEGYSGTAEGDILRGIEAVHGSDFDDQISGNATRNALFGGDGADSLYGNGGNDWINGGAGADLVAGGQGIDMAVYVNSADGVQIDMATGVHTGGDAAGDQLVSIENLAGSRFDDVLIGDGGDNRLVGNGGNDVLGGGFGEDILIGKQGNDTMTGGGNADTFLFRPADGSGTDTITDFSRAEGDVLRFWRLPGADDTDRMERFDINQVGLDTEIALGGRVIILENVLALTLDVDAFEFG